MCSVTANMFVSVLVNLKMKERFSNESLDFMISQCVNKMNANFDGNFGSSQPFKTALSDLLVDRIQRMPTIDNFLSVIRGRDTVTISILTYIYKNYVSEETNEETENILRNNIQRAFMYNVFGQYLAKCKADNHNGKTNAYLNSEMYNMSTGLPIHNSEKMVSYESSDFLKNSFGADNLTKMSSSVECLTGYKMNELISPTILTALYINLLKIKDFATKTEKCIMDLFISMRNSSFFNRLFNDPSTINEDLVNTHLRKFHNDKTLKRLSRETDAHMRVPCFSGASNTKEIYGSTTSFCGSCGERFFLPEDIQELNDTGTLQETTINRIRLARAEHFKNVYKSDDTDGMPKGGSVNYNLHSIVYKVYRNNFLKGVVLTTPTRDVILEILRKIMKNGKGNIYEEYLLFDIMLCATNLSSLLESGYTFSSSEALELDTKIKIELNAIHSNMLTDKVIANYYVSPNSVNEALRSLANALNKTELDLIYSKNSLQ